VWCKHLFGRRLGSLAVDCAIAGYTDFMISQLLQEGVGVEKLQFPPKLPKLWGYKMSRKLKKSFVGHPSAILFWSTSLAGVFQQPQASSTKFKPELAQGSLWIWKEVRPPNKTCRQSLAAFRICHGADSSLIHS
jgi:hypothetical protein